MSRYEWESGTLVIPAKEWSGFKRTLRETYNRLQTLRLELAVSLSAELKTLGRGRRNFDFEAAAEQLFHQRAKGRFSPISQDYFLILQSIFPSCGRTDAPRRIRPSVPKKKDFPQATSKTNDFDCNEGSISLDDKERKFRWHVSENNHACEQAHEHPMASAAFRALDRMNWTRNTGGKITGNDEYNRESKEDGSGANYVVRGYGPLGEDQLLKRFRTSRKRR
jgi:hypothetical protein